MPVTPMADKASRTSSSLNGLMIAVTSFIASPVKKEAAAARQPVPRLALEGLLDVDRACALGDIARVGTCRHVGPRAVEAAVGAAGVRVESPDRKVLGQRVAQTDLPVFIAGERVVADSHAANAALVPLNAVMRHHGPAGHLLGEVAQRKVETEVDVIAAAASGQAESLVVDAVRILDR